MWRVRLFGSLAVEGDGQRIAKFDTLRSAKILAILALSRGGQIRRDDLCEMLWPEDFLDATRLRLRQELSRLRRALGDAAEIVDAGVEFIRLDRAKCDTDLDMLRRAVALEVGTPQRAERLQQAVSLAQEPLLTEWDDLWVTAERQGIAELLSRGRCGLADLLLQEEAYEAALAVGNEAVKSNPCDEAASAIIVKAYAAMGSLTSAVVEFQRLRRELKGRLNQEPSPNIVALMNKLEEKPVNRPSVRSRELPAPVDTLFGRESELEELAARAASLDRLITLVGPGGIGKSRLALEFAHRVDSEVDVLFVNLADTEDASSLPGRLIEALGERASSSDSVQYIAQLLQGAKSLVVLDNLEHLLPSAAGEIRRLLEACPGMKVIATSRTPLGIAGEKTISVGPLDPRGPGVEMLVELWRSVRPTLQLDARAREQAEVLARELDGYPLAIRLAATKLKLRSPADVARDLAGAPLATGSSDLSERHASLDETLQWSFDALPANSQELLIQVAFFRGGCRLDFAENLIDGVGLEAIESALDASLLVLDETRVRLRVKLLEPVRQFVLRTASPQVLSNCEDRYVAWARDFIETCFPGPYFRPHKVETFMEMDDELDSLMAAWKVLLARSSAQTLRAFRKFWLYEATRGRQRELLARLQEAESGLSELADEDLVEILIGQASSYSVLKRDADCRATLLRIEELASKHGWREIGVSTAISLLSLDAPRLSFEQRLQGIRDQIEIARETGSLVIQGYTYMHLGALMDSVDDHEASLDASRLAVKSFLEAGDDIGATRSSQLLAIKMSELGLDDEETIATVRDRTLRLGDPYQLLGLHKLDGLRMEARGRFEEAIEHFNRTISIWRRLSCPERVREILPSLVRCHLELGRLREAENELLRFRSAKLPEERIEVAAMLMRAAHFHALKGNSEKGAGALAKSQALLGEADVKVGARENLYRSKVETLVAGATPMNLEPLAYFETAIMPSAITE